MKKRHTTLTAFLTIAFAVLAGAASPAYAISFAPNAKLHSEHQAPCRCATDPDCGVKEAVKALSPVSPVAPVAPAAPMLELDDDSFDREKYKRVHLAGDNQPLTRVAQLFGGGRDKEDPRHIIIGLDISKSNPLVEDRAFATSVAGYVRDEIEDLPIRSRVWLRTFGVDAAAPNPLRVNRTVTRDMTSDRVGALMHRLVSAVPTLVDRGTIEAQNFTNIVSFLTNMAEVVDCNRYETTIILASDGLEDSRIARLRRQGATLPLPRRGLFRGCSKLLILGIGQGRRNPTTTARLRREWQRWARQAGFRDFQGLNNW